ncbi:hypothetical protein D3C75_729120 [compost metagenome]
MHGLGIAHSAHIHAGTAGVHQVLLVVLGGNREVLVDQAFRVKLLEVFQGIHVIGSHEVGSQLAVDYAPAVRSAEHGSNGFEGAIYQVVPVSQRNRLAVAGQIRFLEFLQYVVQLVGSCRYSCADLVQPVLTEDQTGAGRLSFLVQGVDLAVNLGVLKNFGVQLAQVRVVLQQRPDFPELAVLDGVAHQNEGSGILQINSLGQSAGGEGCLEFLIIRSVRYPLDFDLGVGLFFNILLEFVGRNFGSLQICHHCKLHRSLSCRCRRSPTVSCALITAVSASCQQPAGYCYSSQRCYPLACLFCHVDHNLHF